MDFRELGREDPLLSRRRETAGDATPEDILLAPDSPTGETEPDLSDAPEAVKTNFVPDDPKAGAQQESSEGKPGFLVVHRFFAASHAGFQSWPESTDKGGIPFA